MKSGQITSLIVSATLAGCGLLGPDYSQPKINPPTGWQSKSASLQLESSNLAELAWWKQFNDPQLNRLIESGLANNNNIQSAMGNLLQAQAALQQVKMNWVPNVGLGGVGFSGQSFNPAFQNTSGNPNLNGLTSQNPQNFSGYGAGFMPSYTLNVFSQIKQGEIAKLNLALQEQALNAIRLAVISQLAGSYFSLLASERQLEIQQQMLHDAEEMRHYYLIKYNKGSISELNVSGMDQYIAGLKAKIPEINNDLTQIQNALQVLINGNPGRIMTTNNFSQVATEGLIPLNLPSEVLQNRPDVRVAEYQLQLSNANIGAVRAQFFPSINLTGVLGQGSLQLSNLFNAGGDFWFGQLGAGMPLFNLGLYSQIDKAKGGYYAAYYGYIQTVRSAFAEVDNGISEHNSQQQNAAFKQQALARASEIYSYGQKQQRAGAISHADTLSYKLNVDYTEAALNQARLQQLNSIVNLYQVLGGGYKVESQLSAVKKFADSHDIK